MIRYGLIMAAVAFSSHAFATDISLTSADLLKSLSAKTSFDVSKRNEETLKSFKTSKMKVAQVQEQMMEYPMLYSPLHAAEVDLSRKTVKVQFVMKISKSMESELSGFDALSQETRTKFETGQVLAEQAFSECAVTPIEFKETMIFPYSKTTIDPYGELELVCKVEPARVIDAKTGVVIPEVPAMMASQGQNHVWISINGYPEAGQQIINVKTDSLASIKAHQETIDALKEQNPNGIPSDVQAEIKYNQQMVDAYAPFMQAIAKLDSTTQAELDNDDIRVGAYRLIKH